MRTQIAALLMLLVATAPALPAQAQDPIEQTTKKTTTTKTTTTTAPPVVIAHKKVVRHTRRTRRRPVRHTVRRHVPSAPPGSVTVHTVIRRRPGTRVRINVP